MQNTKPQWVVTPGENKSILRDFKFS